MTDIPENTPEPVPATNQAGEVLAAVLDQNDAMRQELAHVGNLVSDLARAMRVEQANADGTWPDLAGRIQRLTMTALATQPVTSQEGEVKRRHWEEIIGDMTDAGDLPADDAASICDASHATQPAKNKTDDVVRRNGERAVISGDCLGVVRNDAGQHRNVATQPAMSQEGEGKYDHEGRCPGCGEHVADVRNCCGD